MRIGTTLNFSALPAPASPCPSSMTRDDRWVRWATVTALLRAPGFVGAKSLLSPSGSSGTLAIVGAIGVMNLDDTLDVILADDRSGLQVVSAWECVMRASSAVMAPSARTDSFMASTTRASSSEHRLLRSRALALSSLAPPWPPPLLIFSFFGGWVGRVLIFSQDFAEKAHSFYQTTLFYTPVRHYG